MKKEGNKEEVKKALVDDIRTKALSDDEFLTDEELLAMNPMTEFDCIDPEQISQADMDYFYELKDELRTVQKEMRECIKEIEEDTKTLENPKATWYGDEKTEWRHDLSSQRLWLENLRKKQNELRRQIYALTKGNTHGRGKK